MKIAAGIVEYGDPDGLYRLLASLALDQENTIDLAIVVHSRFKYFDIKNIDDEQALRQTQKILSKFPQSRVKLVTLANNVHNNTQVESRNLYFKAAAEEGCDWLLVMDSDEYVARNADWKEFRRQLEFVISLDLPHQIFDIQMEGILAMYRGPRPRLFYRPATIRYWKKHFWFVLEEKGICYKGVGDAGRVIGGIYLLHDKTVRSLDHYNATLGYNEWQKIYEGIE